MCKANVAIVDWAFDGRGGEVCSGVRCEVEATGVLEETFLCGFTGWAKGRRIFGLKTNTEISPRRQRRVKCSVGQCFG